MENSVHNGELRDAAVVALSPEDEQRKIYRLYETYCGLEFCHEYKKYDVPFCAAERLTVIAVDAENNYYAFLNGYGDIVQDDVPLIWITAERKYGCISQTVKHFLSLFYLYPYWREWVKLGFPAGTDIMQKLEADYARRVHGFEAAQKRMLELLPFGVEDNVLDKLRVTLVTTENIDIRSKTDGGMYQKF